MLIEIESVYGDTLLRGRSLSLPELRSQVKHILSEVGEEDFLSIFCARCQYEVLLHAPDQAADYAIDLDTHLVYPQLVKQ